MFEINSTPVEIKFARPKKKRSGCFNIDQSEVLCVFIVLWCEGDDEKDSFPTVLSAEGIWY